MRKRIILLLIVLILVGYTHAIDKHYYFQNYSVRDGLSQNTVNAILQDKLGFLWFGTKDGLNRYDGLSFRQYKCNQNDKRSLGNNFITALYEDGTSQIWVGTDTGVYIYHPDKDSFEPFLLQSISGEKIWHSISTILGDDTGRVWLAVENQGIFCYDLYTRKLVNCLLSDISSISTNVQSLAFDNGKTIWIGFYGDGLYYSKDSLRTIHPYRSTNGKEVFDGEVITKMIFGTYNCLYIGSTHGVQELNLTSGKLRTILQKNELGEDIYCRDLLMVSADELWIGTESGIYIYNVRTDQYTHLSSSMYDAFSLSDNAIYSLCKDREGGIWIGSYFGGVNYYPRPYTYFEKYYPGGDKNGMHGMRVREFCEDCRGFLWIGTEDGGLNRFDPRTQEFSFCTASLNFKNIHGLCLVDDYLWVGTFSKGLKIIDTRTGQVVKSYAKNDSPHALTDNSVFSICKTTTGDIYLGTMFGLLRYNRSMDGFDEIAALKGCFVYDVKEDYNGNLWLATYANGAWRYNVNSKKWENYVHRENDKNSLPYDKVLSIYEDSHHDIWLTTQGGGFCRFDSQTSSFISYDSRNGLPSDVVYQIAEDSDGYFWLTTNSGLVNFDTSDARVRKTYMTANGLLSDQFNYRSSYVAADGTIYLGSIDGFVAFNPKDFSVNNYFPPVVLTDFMLLGQEVHAGEDGSPLEKSIVSTDRIILNAHQNSFSLRVAALSYQASTMNKLMYKLEGFDDNWMMVREDPVISYSNIPYGSYCLRVRASNSDGVWNPKERTLLIEIRPPFYLSGWAYGLYSIFFIGCSFFITRFVKLRNQEKRRRQIEFLEQEKEREIYRAKFSFFTNVAHEIRTPLTLIKAPLENILHKKEHVIDTETREDLNIMEQNTERLLNLTNQLLDFRKAESQGYRLNFTECNISEILRETYIRFTSVARQKGLELTLDLPPEDLYAHINDEAFTKIISNLLNNAVKYAATYVHVLLKLAAEQKQNFSVNILNDGYLIPETMRNEIFKPFIRLEESEVNGLSTGTGIGLALARSLAELHQGSLVMTDRMDVNEFCLTLPIVQETTIVLSSDVNDVKIETVSHEQSEMQKKKLTVLVVEDSADMSTFLSRQLSRDYEVLTATNGIEALETLNANFVNLVVSDVMMPIMDGFELCKRIKADLNYSHIPVILLTAKTSMQSKIQGLELGADAYIEKPFSFEYLLATIGNQISNREKLRQSFAKSPFVAVNTMALTKVDEEFVKKLNDIILANLSNSEFSTDDMAESLNMSRSNFYRKVKGVLDLTPNEYLRLERLKRAAQLLKEGKCRVNEVCYAVGFNSPSYFAKCFLKQFGILPKDFVE